MQLELVLLPLVLVLALLLLLGASAGVAVKDPVPVAATNIGVLLSSVQGKKCIHQNCTRLLPYILPSRCITVLQNKRSRGLDLHDVRAGNRRTACQVCQATNVLIEGNKAYHHRDETSSVKPRA